MNDIWILTSHNTTAIVTNQYWVNWSNNEVYFVFSLFLVLRQDWMWLIGHLLHDSVNIFQTGWRTQHLKNRAFINPGMGSQWGVTFLHATPSSFLESLPFLVTQSQSIFLKWECGYSSVCKTKLSGFWDPIIRTVAWNSYSIHFLKVYVGVYLK